MRKAATVALVDDDQGVRESLVWRLNDAGLRVVAYPSPERMLAHFDPHQPGCFVFELCLPGMTGLELWSTMQAKGCCHPLIIITGHAAVSIAVHSIKAGAIDFLEKPVDHRRLISRIRQALDQDATNRDRRAEERDVKRRIEALTPRQREVMELVVQGRLTKQIASRLGISEKTVEVHRSHITKKMHVESVAQLVRMVSGAGG